MNYFDEMLQELLALLAIDSVQADPCSKSPFGEGVGTCIERVLARAESFGMTVHNEDGFYGTADVGEGKPFGILGHLDVVPYDDDWNANPLGEIKDGNVYGRGVLDDKGPMLCCLYAVKKILDEGYRPTRKLRFIFGGNEETGWKCMERYAEVDEMPEEGFSPDGDFPVIYCEKGLAHYRLTIPMPSDLLELNGGSRGNIVMASCNAIVDRVIDLPTQDDCLTITVTGGKTYLQAQGKPAHASTPATGDNALWHILNYLSRALGGEYTELNNRIAHNDGSGCNLAISDKASGALTFNAGVVSTENGKIMLLIDIRHPLCITKEEVMERLNAALRPDSIELVHFHHPLYVDPDHPLIRKLLAAYDKVTGKHGKPICIGGGTYARVLRCGVAFGPMFPGQESTIHQKDEHVGIGELKTLFEIYYEAIKSICFQ